jgi:EF hand
MQQDVDKLKQEFTFSEPAPLPSCLTQYLDQQCQVGVALGPGGYISIRSSSSDESQQWWSNCGQVQMWVLDFFLKAPSPWSSTGTGDTDYFYMDANCHQVAPGANLKLCGFAAVIASPISLIWEDGAPLADSMTVVPFSIDARQPQAFTLWKASEKAPLLVYDPKHTGKVTSAKQLFGTYTFGGKTTKAAYYQSDETRTPWENGYEALALLDTNHDGKISAKELNALALWFDKNRDGVSQPGEVKPLSSLGVVALYYKPDRTDPKSGDLHAGLGFERLVNGRLVKGASVDWFAQTFSTKQEATVALSAIFQQEDKTSDAAADKLDTRAADLHEQPNDHLGFQPHQATNHREDLSGYWYWTVKEKNGGKHPGIFAFEQVGGHELTGYSLVEAQLAENDKHLRSVLSALPATGTVSRDKEGKLQLVMKILDRKSGGTARSTATLSEDGMTLSGKTTQLLVVEGDGKRRSATVDYEWVARKFTAPAKAARK